jgi:hypothetical protein
LRVPTKGHSAGVRTSFKRAFYEVWLQFARTVGVGPWEGSHQHLIPGGEREGGDKRRRKQNGGERFWGRGENTV